MHSAVSMGSLPPTVKPKNFKLRHYRLAILARFYDSLQKNCIEFDTKIHNIILLLNKNSYCFL